MNKNAFRKNVRAIIKQIKQDDREFQSKNVCLRVINHSVFKISQNISIYLSLQDEINTSPILQHIFASGKKCYIPWFSPNDNSMMKMLPLQNLNEISRLESSAKWNVKQHPHHSSFNNKDIYELGEKLDLIIVPGLAFSRVGCHRLGRGKGYYDKYLHHIHQNYHQHHPFPHTLGLTFKQCIFDEIPHESHDFSMNEIVYRE